MCITLSLIVCLSIPLCSSTYLFFSSSCLALYPSLTLSLLLASSLSFTHFLYFSLSLSPFLSLPLSPSFSHSLHISLPLSLTLFSPLSPSLSLHLVQSLPLTLTHTRSRSDSLFLLSLSVARSLAPSDSVFYKHQPHLVSYQTIKFNL